MKNIARIFMVLFTILSLSSCYDRDIIDSKEFNHSLPKLENLDFAKQESAVKLTWQFPANISTAFKRPLEVSIQVVENGIYRQIITVSGEETSTNIAIEAGKKYHFIVKLLGYLTDEVREKGLSDRAYSEGQIIEIQ